MKFAAVLALLPALALAAPAPAPAPAPMTPVPSLEERTFTSCPIGLDWGIGGQLADDCRFAGWHKGVQIYKWGGNYKTLGWGCGYDLRRDGVSVRNNRCTVCRGDGGSPNGWSYNRPFQWKRDAAPEAEAAAGVDYALEQREVASEIADRDLHERFFFGLIGGLLSLKYLLIKCAVTKIVTAKLLLVGCLVNWKIQILKGGLVYFHNVQLGQNVQWGGHDISYCGCDNEGRQIWQWGTGEIGPIVIQEGQTLNIGAADLRSSQSASY